MQFPGSTMASQPIVDCIVPRITVRIFGRNRLLCEALERLLRRRAGFFVQGTNPGSSPENELADTGSCDVLLADSVDACHTLCQEAKSAPAGSSGYLLLFGMDDNPKHFLDAIRLGASGYLLNDASSEDVVQAIKMVARGEAVCPPKLCMFLFRHFASICGNQSHDDGVGKTHGLTMRQRQLMDLVSKGLSNKEIATRLHLSQFTVKNHIRRILQNVDVETRYQAVDVMRARGILPLSP
jgi:DNA-binding NarL/FixJ family response regulator